MLLKRIVCQVASDSRDAFSNAQAHWRQLKDIEGFRGQFGGWNAGDVSESCEWACIVGLWQDSDSYQNFMSEFHDTVVEASGQAQTYVHATTALFEVQSDISGLHPDLCSAMGRSEFLRVADCSLRPGREAHFRQVQSDIWNPAMVATGGMAAGAFSRSLRDDDRFLVTTLWESEQSHAIYLRDAFAGLRSRAAVEDDVATLHGHGVVLEPSWRVCSAT